MAALIPVPDARASGVRPDIPHPVHQHHPPLNWSWIGVDNAALIDLLTNRASRNFYYNGHGGGESIPIMVTAAKIMKALTNHYYRFVFLDACSTANGSLPQAFGIGFNAPKNLSFFQADGTRPRAFMGYNQDVQFAWVVTSAIPPRAFTMATRSLRKSPSSSRTSSSIGTSITTS